MSTFRALSIAALLTMSALAAQPQRGGGLSGYVVGPDGTPVSGGSAFLVGNGPVSIGADGRFHVEVHSAGPRDLHISVPDFAPHRVTVDIPSSGSMQLPVIRLSAATYFRVRLTTPDGEPIGSELLRRQSFDFSGQPLLQIPAHRGPEAMDAAGMLTIGPLPIGMTVITVDGPGLARVRLPDIRVDGDRPVIEGGTVIVGPGATLVVDLVDGDGAPVAAHNVVLEDVRPLAPTALPLERTDREGRVIFDRLAAGQYRVRTATVDRCQGQPLWIAPVVPIGGSGTTYRRIIVGGSARVRLRSPHDFLPSVRVAASPEAGSRPLPPGMSGRMDAAMLARFSESACTATTDADGRATFENFAPGPATIRVRLPNSTYVRRVVVPENGREMLLQIPEGLLPVRVTSAATNRPVPDATLAWTGGGARVEAVATATGDALLESVGVSGGTLIVSASGHEPAEVQLSELPATTVDVTLERSPSASLDARVVTTAGVPISGAVVALAPQSPGAIGRIATTDRSGLVTFPDAPGAPRLTVAADGFATRTVNVADAERPSVVVPLTQGYRAILTVGLPAAAGRQAIHVTNERGISMDDLLDVASDRGVEPPAAISLGPLPPGDYLVEVRGSIRRQVRVRIVDRDVAIRVEPD